MRFEMKRTNRRSDCWDLIICATFDQTCGLIVDDVTIQAWFLLYRMLPAIFPIESSVLEEASCKVTIILAFCIDIYKCSENFPWQIIYKKQKKD